MVSVLHEADLRLLHWINSERANPFLDWFMALVSDFGFWKWPLITAAVALVIWGGFRAHVLIAMTLAGVLVGEGINGSIKRVTNRPRPYQQLAGIRRVDRSGVEISTPGPVEKGRSMPSSHLANNAAFAFFAGAIFGRWGRLAWIGVLLVGYSRIYVGSHFPSDVVVALLLALGYCNALAWAAQRLWSFWGPQWLATVYDQHPNLFQNDAVLAPADRGLPRAQNPRAVEK